MAQTEHAYDFDRLERHYGSAPLPRVKQPPELKVVKNRQMRNSWLLARAGVMFVLALTIVSAMLYNNVLLTELTAQVETAQGQYKTLKNENRRMQVELEGRVSLRNVEDVAAKTLGMAKIESYQIRYVDLGEGDQVLLCRAKTPTLTDRARTWYDEILEYLK